MQENIDARIERQLDRLDDPNLSHEDIQKIEKKVQVLRAIQAMKDQGK